MPRSSAAAASSEPEPDPAAEPRYPKPPARLRPVPEEFYEASGFIATAEKLRLLKAGEGVAFTRLDPSGRQAALSFVRAGRIRLMSDGWLDLVPNHLANWNRWLGILLFGNRRDLEPAGRD